MGYISSESINIYTVPAEGPESRKAKNNWAQRGKMKIIHIYIASSGSVHIYTVQFHRGSEIVHIYKKRFFNDNLHRSQEKRNPHLHVNAEI